MKGGRRNRVHKKFVLCINNKGHDVSLEKGKVYQVIDDAKASQHNLIRIPENATCGGLGYAQKLLGILSCFDSAQHEVRSFTLSEVEV